MDQLRTILAWLKRQHFWVLSVLIALVAIGCWWSASGTLSKEFTANKQAIEGEFNSLTQARGKSFLPNQTIIDKQKVENTNQAKGVAETWQKLYDRQREHVLEWPADLSPEFRAYVEKRKFGDDIPQRLLNNYQNYAQRYFPELPKIVDALEMEETATGGGYGESAGMGRGSYAPSGRGTYGGGGYGEGGLDGGQSQAPQQDFICEWLDQHVVREKLIFPTRPSPLLVWVTQEDLWVYKTLLNVIRKTNEKAGATRQSNAAVRVIYALEVGRAAGLSSRGTGRIYMPATAAASPDAMAATGEMAPGASPTDPYGSNAYSGEMGGMDRMSMDPGRMGESYGATGGPPTPEQERAFLLSYRYLGEDGKPIAMGGGAADPSMPVDPALTDPAAAAPSGPLDLTQFGLEYKRLPVRMTLQMDHRWLTHLISECANQPLQVEVQEVRINPADLGAAGGEGRGYGMGGYGGGGGGRGYDGGQGGSPFAQLSGPQTFDAQPHIVDVVIQGIIYIFNEPNPEKLNTTDEAQLASTQ